VAARRGDRFCFGLHSLENGVTASRVFRKQSEEMETGIIKNVVVDRGFGFITDDGRGPDCFFHMKALDGNIPWGPDLVGLRVAFDVEDGAEGKGPRAINIRESSTHPNAASYGGRRSG